MRAAGIDLGGCCANLLERAAIRVELPGR